MITIYHNPRCSKSREGLQILEASGQDFKIQKYLDEPLSLEELEKIIKLLNIDPIALVRKGEVIWKEKFKHKKLNTKEIIQAMVDHPKLIERPIVIHGNTAIIGRPPTNIKSIL